MPPHLRWAGVSVFWTLLTLVLLAGFAFALRQLHSCPFGVRTGRNGNNNSNMVEERTDHCAGRLLVVRVPGTVLGRSASLSLFSSSLLQALKC